MKKILSALLVFTLILSTLCILPVAATEPDSVKIGNETMTWTKFCEDYANYVAENVTLIANVDASAMNASLAAFSGTFDGAGYTISGLSVPLFTELAGATVKNVKLAGNVTATGTVLAALSLGATGTVTIERCVNNASLTLTANDEYYVGAFVAYQNTGLTSLTIKACVNNAALTVNANAKYNGGIGGFAGRLNSGNITIEKCVNNGAITTTTKANVNIRLGGMIGRCGATQLTIKNCVNNGAITGTAGLFGGMIGDASGAITVQHCYNNGDIKNTDGNSTSTIGSFLGGMIGRTGNTFSIIASTNKGAVALTLNEEQVDTTTTPYSAAGGIVGNVNKREVAVKVFACYSMATVSATKASCWVHGIIGANKGQTTVTDTLMYAGVDTFFENMIDIKNSVVNPTQPKVTLTNTKRIAAEGENTIESEAAWNATLPIKGIGYQTRSYTEGEDDYIDVRFVSTITAEQCANYDSYGYEIIRYTATSAGAMTVENQTTVYSSLYGVEDYTDGANMGEKTPYYATFVVTGVPANEEVTFVVRPFVVKGEKVTYGNAFRVELDPAV